MYNIVVMSYTKKATKELEKRILIDFDIPVSITTFHSLGMMYIRKIFTDKMCSVVDENDRKEIFLNYFTEKIYKDLMENRHIYKPDFTLDLGRDEVYVEYFGLSDYKDKTHRNKFVNEIFKIIKEEK